MKRLMLLITTTLLFAACNNDDKKNEGNDNKPASMSSPESKQERNKKIIMATMENFSKGDKNAMFKDAAPDFTEYNDGSMPPIKSIDSVKSFINMLRNSLEGYKVENLVYYADGDNVLAVGDWSGIFKKDLMDIKATGKHVKFKDADIFKINDEGKITEHSSVQNLGAVLMSSGMMK